MSVISFIFALISALFWGLASVLEKAGLKGNLDPLTGVTLRSIAIVIVSLFMMLVLNKIPNLFQPKLKDVLLIIAGGLMAGLFGQWTYYIALQKGSASNVVPIAATYPLVTLIFSVIFLNEAISAQKIFGIVFVIGGIILLK